MTVVTTDPQLAQFAVEMAAGRTAMRTEVIPLEDGWLVRNAYIDLSEAEVRRAFADHGGGEVRQAFTRQPAAALREGREREERSRQYREAETGWRPIV